MIVSTHINTQYVLFILNIKDITDGVQSTLEMLANDFKLYRTIKSPHDI